MMGCFWPLSSAPGVGGRGGLHMGVRLYYLCPSHSPSLQWSRAPEFTYLFRQPFGLASWSPANQAIPSFLLPFTFFLQVGPIASR